MKILKLILLTIPFLFSKSYGQTYSVTHFYITQNSTPKSMSAKITITDSTLSSEYYGQDTTYESHKITKIDGTTYYLDNGAVYIISPATNRSERKEGVFYIEMTTTAKLSNPARKSMMYRVIKQ